MTKFRKSILIFGILVLIIGAALGTFIVLSLTGSLKTEAIALEFTVDDAEKTYDGEPLTANGYNITGGYLIEGHTPVVKFTGEQTDVGYGYSGLEVTIVNEAGFDVTKEYDIKVNSGILLVDKCGIRINLTKDDVVYDGNKVDIGDGYAVTNGKLAKGHHVSLTIKDEWFESTGKTVAGETLTALDVEPLIVDAYGRNVTGNYVIALSGKVNIVKRPLTVVPVSAEKIYDGKPLVCTQYRIEGSLAAGHYLIPEFKASKSGGAAEVINANDNNPLEITASAKIYDVNNNDVTANYAIPPSVAYLTVHRASLTITAKSGSWEYDGTEHTLSKDNEAGSVTGLAQGDEVTVEYSGGVTDVSVVGNRIERYFINNEENDESNYKVTLVDGKLEVTKAPLTVKWGSFEKDYDGKPFSSEQDNLYEIASAVKNISLKFDKRELNDRLAVFKTPGNTTYTLTNFEIRKGIDSGEEDEEDEEDIELITKMFNISVIAGNLKISPLKISLNTNTLQKEYDGNFVFTENLPQIENLVKNHKLVSITCNAVSLKTAPYSTKIKSVSLEDEQGNNVNGCYEITDFNGDVTLNFTSRELQLKSKTIERPYDGTALLGNNITYGALADGDRIEYEPCEITEFGEIDNKPDIKIFNRNNIEVTGFYKTMWSETGKLKITKRPLSIEIEKIEGTSADLAVKFSQDLTGLLVISNLAVCDGNVTVKFFDSASGSEITQKRGLITTDYSKSRLKAGVTIQLWNNGKDVSGNYEIPTEITGTVIVTYD